MSTIRRTRQITAQKTQSGPSSVAGNKPGHKKQQVEEAEAEGSSVAEVAEGIQSLEIAQVQEAAEPTETPIHFFDLLPDELLIAIFTAFVSSFLEPVNRHKAPAILLRVCTRFLRVAAGTPSLWSTVVASADLDARRFCYWLALDRRPPHVDVHTYVRNSNPREYVELLRQLVILDAFNDQWRSVNARTNNWRSTNVVFTHLTARTRFSLEELVLKCNRPASSNVLLVLPKLKKLVLKNIHMHWRNMIISTLEHFEVSFRQLNEGVWTAFRWFLQNNAGTLRFLSIRLEETVLWRPPLAEPLNLPLLDTLHVTDLTRPSVPHVMTWFETPSLKKVHLGGESGAWVEEQGSGALKSIEELEIWNLKNGELMLGGLVPHLPKLKKLKLQSEGVSLLWLTKLIQRSRKGEIDWTVRLAIADCFVEDAASEEEIKRTQEWLDYLAANSDFSIKAARHSIGSLPWECLPTIPCWRLVDDPEWGQQVWLPPVPDS